MLKENGGSDMNVIFLDIDGVMNNVYSSVKSRNSPEFEIIDSNGVVTKVRDNLCWLGFRVLNQIIDKTKAKVVLSSTWRKFYTKNEMNQIFKHYKFKGELIDYTPVMSGEKRGTEIQKWIDDCELDIESFIIIDDDTDMLHLRNRLIKTDAHFGLNHTHEDEAVALMNT